MLVVASLLGQVTASAHASPDTKRFRKEQPTFEERERAFQKANEECENEDPYNWDCIKTLEVAIEDLKAYPIECSRKQSLLDQLWQVKLRLAHGYASKQQDHQAREILLSLMVAQKLAPDKNLLDTIPLNTVLYAIASSLPKDNEQTAQGHLKVQCPATCRVLVNDTVVASESEHTLPLSDVKYQIVVLCDRQKPHSNSVKRIALTREHPDETVVCPNRKASSSSTNTDTVTDVETDTNTQTGTETNTGTDAGSSSEVRTPNQAKDGEPGENPRTPTARCEPNPHPCIVESRIHQPVVRVGMATGIVTAAVGGFLIGMDRYCLDYGIKLPDKSVPCKPNGTLQSKNLGFALVGLGASLILTGAAIMTIERIRGKRSKSARTVFQRLRSGQAIRF